MIFSILIPNSHGQLKCSDLSKATRSLRGVGGSRTKVSCPSPCVGLTTPRRPVPRGPEVQGRRPAP